MLTSLTDCGEVQYNDAVGRSFVSGEEHLPSAYSASEGNQLL